MKQETRIPGLFLKVEWAKQFEKFSNEEVGVIIKNLYRRHNNLELLEMTFASEILFETAILPAYEFNSIKYAQRLEANKNNGAKGGAPKGNQNAKKQQNSTQNNPKQHKDTVSYIVKDLDKVIINEKDLSKVSLNEIDLNTKRLIEEFNDGETIVKNILNKCLEAYESNLENDYVDEEFVSVGFDSKNNSNYSLKSDKNLTKEDLIKPQKPTLPNGGVSLYNFYNSKRK